VFYNTHHPIKSARAKAGRWGNLLKTAPRRQTCAGCAGSVIVVFSGIARGGPDVVDLILAAGAVLRWLHVIAGIAWIGSSFYFIHLDLSLKARPGLPAGVKGDEWQVRGDGFYHMMKYLVAPAQMPDSLT
jgi:Urate oxidase N-terminal